MKTLLVAFIAGLGLIGGTANAEGDFAIGGSVGQVTIGDNNGGADFDGDDIAYKVFANWMMNDYFGFEGGYVDFGEPDDVDILGQTLSIEATGWNLYLVGNIPLSENFDLFGKAGALMWDGDSYLDDVKLGSDDGTDLGISAGLRWKIGSSFALRGEFDWYDISDINELWMVSIGAEFRF